MISSAPEVHIAPGTVVLDKYRVIRTIGVGGMGVVVEATHIGLGRQVAIKFLLPQFAASREATRRFLREAQAASKIRSEHIAQVSDTGQSAPWGPFIVMEYLEGTDLARRIRHHGTLSVETAIDFTVQAALALGEAHSAGVVHRDVKPANLFVAERADGSPLVKVLDFGISKVTETTSLEVTKTTAVLGSGLYMSPEQMKASKSVDHRTDIYGLGITLFELITGTQPFTADSFAELCIKVNMEPPTPLRQYRRDVPVELAMVIERAYAKLPEDRYQSMASFAAALAPWANPHTRIMIDALVRLEARSPRRASSPSLPTPGSVPPFATLDGELRIPPPPSMPSPSSMGMDTFGLSPRKKPSSIDPLGQTAAKSFASGGKTKASDRLVGIGVGVGVLMSAAAVALYLLSDSPGKPGEFSGQPAGVSRDVHSPGVAPTGAPAASIEPVAPHERNTLTPAVTPSASPAATALEVVPQASASADPASSPGKPPRGQLGAAAPTLGAPSAAPTTTPVSTAWGATSAGLSAPPAPPTALTTEPPAAGTPCKLRDIDGTVKDCPK